MGTPYTWDLARSADTVDRCSWDEICRPTKSPYLDLPFLRAVERSFSDEAEFWYAIFREGDRPVACTVFSQYLVDGALMAPPRVQRVVEKIRKVWKSFLKYRIMLGGVPLSTCDHQLAIAPDADIDRLAPAFDVLAQELARETRCKLISFKEFQPDLARRLRPLAQYDYQAARSVVAYNLHGEYASFDEYLASRSKRTRANIRKHFKKFEAAGLTCEHLRGRDGVEKLFTEDVHNLYVNVLNRAVVKFERIPVEFFRELAINCPDDSCFTIIRKEGKIVGFCSAIASPGAHNMLYCGLDYSLNADADLYFNIIFRGLAQGLKPGVRMVHIGAGADEFKQHMGCEPEILSVYVKAVGAARQFLFNQVFGLLFDTTPLPEPTLPAIALEPAPAVHRPAA